MGIVVVNEFLASRSTIEYRGGVEVKQRTLLIDYTMPTGGNPAPKGMFSDLLSVFEKYGLKVSSGAGMPSDEVWSKLLGGGSD